jgi:hypothetical protein
MIEKGGGKEIEEQKEEHNRHVRLPCSDII